MSEADKSPDALIEQGGHTLILTLNRPEARNALSTEMLSIMVEAWDRVDNDPEIRSCILTGAGGYFCAGMDLKAATNKPPGDSFKDGSYDPSRIDGLLNLEGFQERVDPGFVADRDRVLRVIRGISVLPRIE